MRSHVAVLHPSVYRFTEHQANRPGSWESASVTSQKPSLFTHHRSYCRKHRPTQNIHQGSLGEESCVLCCENLSRTSVENIQSPCCSQAIYHRKCIQVGLSVQGGRTTFRDCPALCLEPGHSGNAQVCVRFRTPYCRQACA